jgi:hypothetical protein
MHLKKKEWTKQVHFKTEIENHWYVVQSKNETKTGLALMSKRVLQ